jgi:hypothetical protein
VATTTSTGTAKTENDQRSAAQPAAPAPPTTVVLAAPPATTTVVTAPAAPKPVAAPCPAKPKAGKVPAKDGPDCEKATEPGPADKTASREPNKS